MKIGIIIPIFRLNLQKTEEILKRIETKKFNILKIIIFVHKFEKSELKKIKNLRIKNLKVFIEKERVGKIGVLKKSIKLLKNCELIVVINGDIRIRERSLKNLLLPFMKCKEVGSTTGRGILEGKYSCFISFFNELVCKLHHEASLKKTKLSQFYSFRQIPFKIPFDIVSDEAFIEAMMKKFKLKNIYAKDAIFYYSSPNSISKLFEQRRRNFIGNLQVKSIYHYNVSTILPLNKFTIKTFLTFIFKNPIFMFFSLFLEMLARSKAIFDYFVLKEKPYKWKIVTD